MGKSKKLIILAAILMAMPSLNACAHKDTPTMAQNLDTTLDTASGNSIAVTSPSAIIGNPEATKVALDCQNKANNVKTGGQTDAAAAQVYYDCLQASFHIAQ